MSEIIDSLQQKIGLSGDQASAAVSHVMDYLKSKLPDSLHEHLDAAATSGSDLTEELKTKAEGFLSSIKSKFNV